MMVIIFRAYTVTIDDNEEEEEGDEEPLYISSDDDDYAPPEEPKQRKRKPGPPRKKVCNFSFSWVKCTYNICQNNSGEKGEKEGVERKKIGEKKLLNILSWYMCFKIDMHPSTVNSFFYHFL